MFSNTRETAAAPFACFIDSAGFLCPRGTQKTRTTDEMTLRFTASLAGAAGCLLFSGGRATRGSAQLLGKSIGPWSAAASVAATHKLYKGSADFRVLNRVDPFLCLKLSLFVLGNVCLSVKENQIYFQLGLEISGNENAIEGKRKG